jgi:hypothetical protein
VKYEKDCGVDISHPAEFHIPRSKVYEPGEKFNPFENRVEALVNL